MRFMLMVLLVALTALGVVTGARADAINVWPGMAPSEQTANPGSITDDHSGNVTRMTDVTQPQLIPFLLTGRGKHPAVIVLPGGGYSILSVDLEGDDIAKWLNGLGFSAFVLHYRVPNNRPGAFQDGQRALSLVRSNAKKYGIDPSHIGVMGFSAGGHLAARLASGFAVRSYTPVDIADNASCRPDFAVLVYPAYLFDPKTYEVAAEVQPNSDTPPTFITQTRDDPFFDADAYADALEDVGVQRKRVIYPKGGHGYGLRLPSSVEAHNWSLEAGNWLRECVHMK